MRSEKDVDAYTDPDLCELRFVGSMWEGYLIFCGNELQVLVDGDEDGPDADAMDLLKSNMHTLDALEQEAFRKCTELASDYYLQGVSADSVGVLSLMFTQDDENASTIFVEFVEGEYVKAEIVD